MEYLILMTMAGSVLCLIYRVWERCFDDFLTQSIRYRALTITLLVYLIPWIWLKGIYGYVVYWSLPVRVPVIAGHPVAIADIVTEEEAFRTPDYWWQLLAVGLWLLVALVRMAKKSKRYFNGRRVYLDTAEKCQGGVIMETVECLRRELHYKGRLEVFITPDKNTTFTLGAFRPLIFLQEEYSEEQLYFILKHEMIHVVRRDLLKKLLLEFACCVHWFNYLIYALNDSFNEMCEKACDERVLRDGTEEDAKVYARLLAENYSRLKGEDPSQWRKTPFGSTLVNTLETTMERVNLIVKGKVVMNWKKRLAAGVFAVLVVANSFTAMAYPDVYHVESDSAEAAEGMSDGSAFWAGDIIGDGYNEVMTEVLYDGAFIDNDGNMYEIEPYSPYVFCIKHNIVSGYVQTHHKEDDGGCTVKIYESTKCTICNTIWVGDLANTVTWAKCPH